MSVYKKELSKNEKYADKWFKENGFEIIKCKQYISKTIYYLVKNNIEDVFELPNGVTEIKKYMNLCKNNYELKVEILRLQKILDERNK